MKRFLIGCGFAVASSLMAGQTVAQGPLKIPACHGFASIGGQSYFNEYTARQFFGVTVEEMSDSDIAQVRAAARTCAATPGVHPFARDAVRVVEGFKAIRDKAAARDAKVQQEIAEKKVMAEREATAQNRLRAGNSGPKRDILGLYPGMTREEADAVWKNNGWKCVPTVYGISFAGSDASLSCPTSSGKITFLWGKTTNVVYRVQFVFQAGGGMVEVGQSVSRQFSVALKEQVSDLCKAVGIVCGYQASLGNGIELTLKGAEDFTLTIESPRAWANEEEATRQNDLRQRPAPRF